MRKVRLVEAEALPAPRRRRDVGLALLVALVLTPIAYESAARCVARWRSMVGPSVTVETPVLNATQETLSRVVFLMRYELVSTFNHTPWNPVIVIGCGMALALLASIPLRRTH